VSLDAIFYVFFWGGKIVKKLLISVFVFAAMATASNAASVNVYTTATTQNNSTTPTSDTDTNFLNNQSTTAQSTYSVSSSSTLGQTSASSFALADGDTGVMRTTSEVSGSNFDGTGQGGTNASVVVKETYSLSGKGTLTASILLDGSWDLSRIDRTLGALTPSWQVQSNLTFNNIQQQNFCLGTSCGPSVDRSNSGSISNYLLTASIDFDTSRLTSPKSILIGFDLLSQISVGNGFIDFGNTAKLLVETSGTLIATPSDPDFLSDPAFLDNPSAIPLPAGMVLMLTALAGLGAARLRRDRK
jgi:hypothetical protein